MVDISAWLALGSADLALPDDLLAQQAWDAWINYQAARKGIRSEAITPKIREQICAATLGMDTDNVLLVSVEKALRACASGDLARAGGMFRAHVKGQAINIALLDEAVTGRRKQRDRAQKPRQSALRALIGRLLNEKPQMTWKECLAELHAESGRGVITSTSGEDIEYVEADGRPKKIKISGLKDLLSRAKKDQDSR